MKKYYKVEWTEEGTYEAIVKADSYNAALKVAKKYGPYIERPEECGDSYALADSFDATEVELVDGDWEEKQ